MTFLTAPPMATMLVARGGDTLWSSMALACDALSEGLKHTLDNLCAVHANVRKLGLGYENTAPPEPSVDDYNNAEGTLHPAVIRHPETGRKCLYINGEYTIRFERWTRQESLGLLQFLLQHGQRPEFGVRFHWRPGSVAFWDNRQVWHLAVNDDRGMPRVMNRTVLKGTEPLPANA